jgi:hypothetical protein
MTHRPGDTLRGIFRGVAIALLVLAGLLALLGVAAWPPGGLMFALPYLFLLPALVLALGGGVLLLLTRAPRPKPPDREI